MAHPVLYRFLNCCFLYGLIFFSVFLYSEQGRAELVSYDTVRLKALNKITARTEVFETAIDENVQFGSLKIRPKTCRKSQPIDPPRTASFLEVWEIKPDYEKKWVFSGWMFASSPALSSLDHPIYDIWIVDCTGQATGEKDDADFIQLLEEQSLSEEN